MTYQSSSHNVNQTWDDYKRGFVSIDNNFWLGNAPVSHITTKGMYRNQYGSFAM